MDDVAAMMAGLTQLAQAAGSTLAEAVPGAQAVDFSVGAMFARASLVVQAVMVVLVLASFWSWAIIIEKIMAFRRIGVTMRDFDDAFWSGQPLDELYDRLGEAARTPSERVFGAGMQEWRRSFRQSGGLIPGTLQRVERKMAVAIQAESEGFNKRLSFLATVGSVSPFVGLFGTVWGIKESFEAIATQQSTNLAVVAPGIAEALLATAMGLLAAIPAVVAYNRLVADADGLTGALEAFSDEFATILGRQIDRAGEAVGANAGRL